MSIWKAWEEKDKIPLRAVFSLLLGTVEEEMMAKKVHKVVRVLHPQISSES